MHQGFMKPNLCFQEKMSLLLLFSENCMTICYTAHGNYSVKSIQNVVSNRWDEISFKQPNVHDKTSISNILTQKGCMLKSKVARSFLWNVLKFQRDQAL